MPGFPNISVVMATYNGARFLQAQLDSLARQTCLPLELVVTDDGSTDATLEIMATFATTAPFPVRVVRNDSRLGYGRNFLKAASLAMGSHIAFCDQDDVWLPNKLQRVASAIVTHRADLVVHSGYVVDAELSELGARYPDFESDGFLRAGTSHGDDFWPGFALVVNRRLLDLGGASKLVACPELCAESFAHDEWICDLVATTGTRAIIAEGLVLYRQHGRNLIGFHGATQRQQGQLNIQEAA